MSPTVIIDTTAFFDGDSPLFVAEVSGQALNIVWEFIVNVFKWYEPYFSIDEDDFLRRAQKFFALWDIKWHLYIKSKKKKSLEIY